MSVKTPSHSSRGNHRSHQGESITTLSQRVEHIYWQEWNAMMAHCPESTKPLFLACGQRLRARLLEKTAGIVHEAENLMCHRVSAIEQT